MVENGIELGEMNRLLLQKIEELTLHLIEKENEIAQIKSDMQHLSERVKNMEPSKTDTN